MQNIGTAIKIIRESEGLSVQSMAEGICSSKYIYMIEKNERVPSVFIMSQMNKKVDFDLFNLIPFGECDNPLIVATLYDQLTQMRRQHNIEGLKTVLSNLPAEETLTDEIIQYIKFNQIALEVHDTKNYKKAKQLTKEALAITGRELSFDNLSLKDLNTVELFLYIQYIAIKRSLEEVWDAEKTIDLFINFIRTIPLDDSRELLYMIVVEKIFLLSDQNRYRDALIFTENVLPLLASTFKSNLHVIYYLLTKICIELKIFDEAKVYAELCIHLSTLNKDWRILAAINALKPEHIFTKEKSMYEAEYLTNSTGIDLHLIGKDIVHIIFKTANNDIFTQFKKDYLALRNTIKDVKTNYVIYDMSHLRSFEMEMDFLKVTQMFEAEQIQTQSVQTVLIKVVDPSKHMIMNKLSVMSKIFSNMISHDGNQITVDSSTKAFKIIRMMKSTT